MVIHKEKTSKIRIVGIIGTVVMMLCFIIGVIGILMFIVISQDYDADRKFTFEFNRESYETRRYSFGFATLDDTRYSFETYRTYSFILLERKIDTTWFFDTKTNLLIGEPGLLININKKNGRKYIIFKSTNGYSFSKAIQ